MCDACLESNSPILPEAKSPSLQNDNKTTYLKSISGKIDSLREVVSNQNSKNLADSPANKSQLKDVVDKSLEEKLPEVIAKSFKDTIITNVSLIVVIGLLNSFRDGNDLSLRQLDISDAVLLVCRCTWAERTITTR